MVRQSSGDSADRVNLIADMLRDAGMTVVVPADLRRPVAPSGTPDGLTRPRVPQEPAAAARHPTCQPFGGIRV